MSFVVAFGIGGSEFAHLLAAGEIALASFGYLVAGFAIVWAWINFTWFASAFDTDDWAYRLVTLLLMVGVVILALGLSPFFGSLHHGHLDNTTMVLGYVVMRIAMMLHWGRAYRQCPSARPAARVYLLTILTAQAGWTLLALMHTSIGGFVIAAVVLVVVELSGPAYGERLARTASDGQSMGTPWHPHHMAERYGLLVIITLGEGVIGTVAALSSAVSVGGGWTVEAVLMVVAGITVTFGMWWIYFAVDWARGLHAHPDRSFRWGYGHIPLFVTVAATGAGLHVAGYYLEGAAKVSEVITVASLAVPVGGYVLLLFVLYIALMGSAERLHLGLLTGTLIVLATSLALAAAGAPMGWCLMVLMVAPWVTVVGYETVGHRYQAVHLTR